jgi:uncharacterized protein (TIGR03086 family)
VTAPVDLAPAARRLADLVEAVPDAALDGPTPCADFAVRHLLGHIAGFAVDLRAAAAKDPDRSAPPDGPVDIDDGWRTRIPGDLAALAVAWAVPEAWTGVTSAGGVELPAEVFGLVALDELVLHGWDLARSIGVPDGYDGPGLEAVHDAVRSFRGSGIEGIFGPEVPVADDAPLLDRILGIAGRDPAWMPAGSVSLPPARTG